MFKKVQAYLTYKGKKYVKPEKAGEYAFFMNDLRDVAQAARNEFIVISQELAKRTAPFQAERVSQWMNQAQICRPHFWCYYRLPSDHQDDVAMAIRLYGTSEQFGISVEVSIVERKKSEHSLNKQNRVLNQPISAPLYYFVQENGNNYRMNGTEENRQSLVEKVKIGRVRKVLVKQDIPITAQQSDDNLLNELTEAFNNLLPYYEVTKK